MWKDGFIYNNVSFLVINELHFPLVHHSQMCRTDLKEKDVEERRMELGQMESCARSQDS